MKINYQFIGIAVCAVSAAISLTAYVFLFKSLFA